MCMKYHTIPRSMHALRDLSNFPAQKQIRRAFGPEACGSLGVGAGVLIPVAMTIRVLPGGTWPRTST